MERNVVSDYLFFHHPVQMMAKNLKSFLLSHSLHLRGIRIRILWSTRRCTQIDLTPNVDAKGNWAPLIFLWFRFEFISPSIFSLPWEVSPWQFARRKTLEFNYEANWVKLLSKRKLRWTCNACRMSLKIVILLLGNKMKPEIRRKVALWSRAECSMLHATSGQDRNIS